MMVGYGLMAQEWEMKDVVDDIEVDTSVYIECRHSMPGYYGVEMFDGELDGVPMLVVQNGDTLAIGVYGYMDEVRYAVDDTVSMVRIYGAGRRYAMRDCELDSLYMGNYPELEEMLAYRNHLKGVDLSRNVGLKSLDLSDNMLGKIDVSGCANLRFLMVERCGLDTLDLSRCGRLHTIKCNENSLRSLVFVEHARIESLNCTDNGMGELNLDNVDFLTRLECGGNGLSGLDLSRFSESMYYLDCSNNELVGLDLEGFTRLGVLACWGNGFTTGWYDSLYCGLPINEDGLWGDLYCGSDSTVLWGTNGENLSNRHWNLMMEVTETTDSEVTDRAVGDYVCEDVVKIEEVENVVELSVYPNPVDDVCVVKVLGMDDEAWMELVDMNGRMVKGEWMRGEGRLGVEDLVSGIYVLRVMGSDWMSVEKVVVR